MRTMSPCVLQPSLGCTDTNGRYSVAIRCSSASERPSPSLSGPDAPSEPASAGEPAGGTGASAGGAGGGPVPLGPVGAPASGEDEHAPIRIPAASAVATSFRPM